MNRSRLLMIGGLALAVGLLVASPSITGCGPLPAQATMRAACRSWSPPTIFRSEPSCKLTMYSSSLSRNRAVPPGAFSDTSQVLGRGAVLPVSKGEFILPSKLAALNAGAGLPSMIPQGMRAVSVRVNDVVSVAGFVQPGTRVDVLATGQAAGNERQTTTVLENVAVIAVGKSLDRRLRGCANRPGDYASGFSGRRAEAGAGFAGRTNSAVFAQSAGHEKGRHRRDADKFAVPGRETGGDDRAQTQSLTRWQRKAPTPPTTSALYGRNDPWQQTG